MAKAKKATGSRIVESLENFAKSLQDPKIKKPFPAAANIAKDGKITVKSYLSIQDMVNDINDPVFSKEFSKFLYLAKFDGYQHDCKALARKGQSLRNRLINYGFGIVAEGGEVADHIKKHVSHGHDLDKEKIVEELGDVLWYVGMMADTLGYQLSEIARLNLDKLNKRYPNGFSIEDSINRAKAKALAADPTRKTKSP